MNLIEKDVFRARSPFPCPGEDGVMYRIQKLEEDGVAAVSRLPYSIKILLEAALRQCDGFQIRPEDVERIARWSPDSAGRAEIPFKPGRVLMQDFTGVPAVVDLAAMRDAMVDLGGDPGRVNPLIPVDLVIDHSVQVDYAGRADALQRNVEREFARNHERYAFLRWGQEAFRNFRVVPPATGIVHQVNLEYLAQVVRRDGDVLFPDTLVGTDSHTTMINGLGVLGWGVGGIEAEAVMLGQPIYMLLPPVVGLRLDGELPAGTTATDLVLTVTQLLRGRGVVGKFVEFHGPGVARLSLADRATLANMAPEYGATLGLFPVDEETLGFLARSGRSAQAVARVRAYLEAQGMFYRPDQMEPLYSETLSLDMSTVEPSVAGPRRPQDRVPVSAMKTAFTQVLAEARPEEAGSAAAAQTAGAVDQRPAGTATGARAAPRSPGKGTSSGGGQVQRQVVVEMDDGQKVRIGDGAVVIAAITSCTNTSNPDVMVAAGLLARHAVERGLAVPAYVKTSLAPGSRVVTRYLDASGLTQSLNALGFHTVGYGCTTCIGNSGPLSPAVAAAVEREDLFVCSVLSGNRNFEGRVHALTRANYLASPPLVVAYALAGRVDIDLQREPLGVDRDGRPVFLREIWPSRDQVRRTLSGALVPEMFTEEYSGVFRGNEAWNRIPVAPSQRYPWNADSTYIRAPDFFADLTRQVPSITPLHGARVLARLGDSVTTDHISPAGAIAADSPAARYLEEHGVPRAEWNSYGSRRGNHEVMMRGTFANIRIRNELVPAREGGWTRHLPDSEPMTIYDAAMRYRREGVPVIILAGKEYGTGSSRDWAAKGPFLLGVRAVIAESYERIHRSNLIGMGILPLQFVPGTDRNTLSLTGEELYDIPALDDDLHPGQELEVVVRSGDGGNAPQRRFTVLCRIDTPVEIEYYRNGGILHTVLRRMAAERAADQPADAR